MKRLFWGFLPFVLIVVASVFIISCGDDDDSLGNEANDPNSIIGKWKHTFDNGTGWANYEFLKNGKCLYKGSEDAYTLTWKTDGDLLEIGQDVQEYYIYEINNGVMKWWYVGDKRKPEDKYIQSARERTPSVLHKEISNKE